LQNAQDAYKRALASGDPRIAPVAALYLGRLFTDRGDIAGARAAYESALDFGKEDIARKLEAAVRARFAELQNTGTRPVHLEFLDMRRRRPDREAIAAAALSLGNLLQDQADIDSARIAYEDAIEFGDANIGPKAVSNLGIMLHLHGDVAGARAAYQRALDSGHPKVGPLVAFNLGFLLAQNGDVNGARKAYQCAIEFGDSEIAKDAARRIIELDNQTQV
jgi:tetratricopeptide (TPR) repeat protein